ncbi:MAG TPA: DUF6457 domain-containing protein [Gaiellaceae bacterium]|nr:DUF6457 domain-containing protein [Gaiellaceae bacterium]
MDAWLEAAVARLALETGAAVPDYTLTQAEIDELLELARIAAHESGERTNAPLLCYLVGLARGRGGHELDDLVDAAAGKRI